MIDEKYNQGCNNVREFIVKIRHEWNRTISTEINRFFEMEYETAITLLENFAHNYGYTFSLQDWESYVKEVIEGYKTKSTQEFRRTIDLLSAPLENHCDGLKEYVFEICDYEGDPSWSKEEDYQYRVDYVIESLEDMVDESDQSLLSTCDQDQLEGKGWKINQLGLSCDTGHSKRLISWDKIM